MDNTVKRKLLYVLMFGATSGLIGCASGGGGGGPGPGTGSSLPPVVVTTPPSGGGNGGTSGGSATAPSSDPVISTPVPDPIYSASQLNLYGFTPGTRTQVPFSAPQLAGTFSPYNAPNTADQVSQQYVVHNLTGDGADALIIAGRQTQPATPGTWSNSTIQLFDWQDGKLVNDTAKWFPKGINSILGTDPTVQFADFFHTGRTDMLVSPSTDMQYFGPTGNSQAWLFRNTGSQFNLNTIDLGTTVWAHGASLADLTGSGYLDVLMTGYANTVFLMNNHVDGFTPYKVTNFPYGASSIVAADFLGNGSTQVVVTDSCCTANAGSYKTTQMYSWNIDSNKQLTFGFIKNLPTPIFDQPQYGFGASSTHNYLAITNDFVGNGIPDLILFGSPVNGAKMSAIQFLQNDGHGNFTDVTASMLKGYNMNTYGSYHPQFIDLGNGLPSMIVSSSDYTGQNNSTQILIKQSVSGPYVSAFQNIVTDFASEANLIAGVNNSANQVAMVRDAKNNLYLVSTVEYQKNGQTMMGTYVSLVGPGITTVTAQTAFNQVKTQWPWMSSAQVNQVLAGTASSYLTAAGPALVLNPNNLLTPLGALSVNNYTFTGGIVGVNMSNLSVQAFDTLGRNFAVNFSNPSTSYNSYTVNSEHVDQYSISSHSEYLINGNVNLVYTPMGPMRLGYENRNLANTLSPLNLPQAVGVDQGDIGLYLGTSPLSQWSVGLPQWYHKDQFSLGTQLTNLNTNPWINFNGSFGAMQGSMTLEQVATYMNDGFSVQGAVMYTTTAFTPGLITAVSPVIGAWAETGYRYSDYNHFGDLGLYLGVKPTVLSGSIEANLPTSVDSHGAPVYTKQNLAINSIPLPYARALYTANIDRRQSVRLSGMVAPDGLYRAMVEYRINLN